MIAEEAVLVLGRLHRLALGRVGGREHQATMHGERQRAGEEQRDGDHMRRIVMKVQELVADVRHPIEVADDAIGEGVPPGAQQHRADDFERHKGQDREGEGDRHMQADAELAADLHLAQRPAHEGAGGADGDDLPEAALPHRRKRQPVREVGRSNVDLPEVPRRPDGRRIDDECGAQHREEGGQHTEEAHIEGPDPEVEQVTADQRAAAYPVLLLKTQHCHCSCSVPAQGRHASIGAVRGRNPRWNACSVHKGVAG